MKTKNTKRKTGHGASYVLIILSTIMFSTLVLVYHYMPQAMAVEQIITIPQGAFDPNFNTIAPQWYMPNVVTVQVNQTVMWTNQDTEGHTVTSGKAGGREGLVQNNMGQPNGIFDSGTIKPGKSWSYTFTKVGQYEYFCTVHPWMDGFIVVNQQEPTPTDADGNKITKFPLVRYVPDRTIEADLGWEPHYIMTGHKITFVYQFYNNVREGVPIPAHYVFTITQNGQELYKREDSTQFGGGYTFFKFDNPGPATFKFDDVAHTGQSVQYTTMVEQPAGNMQGMAGMDDNLMEPARNMDLQNSLIPIFFTPALATAGVIVLYYKVIAPKRRAKTQ